MSMPNGMLLHYRRIWVHVERSSAADAENMKASFRSSHGQMDSKQRILMHRPEHLAYHCAEIAEAMFQVSGDQTQALISEGAQRDVVIL